MAHRECSECGAPAKARGLCGKHYMRRRYEGDFQTNGKGKEDLDLVPPEFVRECLSEGICPVCADGPFAAVLNHTAAAHKLSAREVKVYAQLAVKPGFVDSQLRETMSENWKNNPNAQASAARFGTYSEKASAEGLKRRASNPTIAEYERWAMQAERFARFLE